MARTPNYDQDKRRKELERKNRKEAKRLDRDQRRLDRQSSADPAAPEEPSGAAEAPDDASPPR
jgi:hypothetical protein